eukprot:1872361-Alexandrium_andersonii.AAC.1
MPVRRGEQIKAGTCGEAPARRRRSNAPGEVASGGSRVLDAARGPSTGPRGAGGRAASLAQATHGQPELRVGALQPARAGSDPEPVPARGLAPPRRVPPAAVRP